MVRENEGKKLAPADFVAFAKKADATLQGFVAYDLAMVGYILFGVSPTDCPEQPIAESLIEFIEVGKEHSCTGRTHRMWDAKIVLKTDESDKTGSLLRLAVHLASAAKHASCSCKSKSRRRGREQEWTCCFYDTDGQYAGSSISPVYQNLVDQCDNWVNDGNGTCNIEPGNVVCPQ